MLQEEEMVQITIPMSLYEEIEKWRIELSRDYHLANLDTQAFIKLLLSRAHMDVAIMLWNPTEGISALKEFKRNDTN